MSVYGQFCPVSRAAEMLGERWTLLIVRELLQGSTRFSELQRGMPKISPSLLTKRLQELENARILYRRQTPGQKGFEYQLTPAGQSLHPLVMELARWGINWIEGQLSEDELDIELLMFDIHRSLDPARFPDGTITLKFHFRDAEKFRDWWILASRKSIDLCTKDPGNEPHAYLSTSIRALTELWTGQVRWNQAMRSDTINVVGSRAIVRQIPAWLGTSPTVALKADT